MSRELDLWDPFRHMRRTMLDAFSGFPVEEGIRQPLVDVVDKGKEIVITAELPGVEKGNIDLQVDEDSLTISAKSGSEVKKEKEEEGYFFHERSFSSFSRTIPLPDDIIPEKADAEFRNGVLTVSLPKKNPTEHKKKGFKVDIK